MKYFNLTVLLIAALSISTARAQDFTEPELPDTHAALQNNKLVGLQYTNMVLGLFQNIENPNQRPKGFGIAGGAPVGINAVIQSNFESGYIVIVLSNYDPPAASELGRSIFELLMNQKTS